MASLGSMYRIGIATSGGDAPGMNACVRAVVKGALPGHLIVGIRNGGLGLLRNSSDHEDYIHLHKGHVAGILNRAGTILKTARESRFREFVVNAVADSGQDTTGSDMTRQKIYAKSIGELGVAALAANHIDGLILIGGDTTCRAAELIYRAAPKLPIVVIPATIDNDIRGTVQTIGFDSAVSMAVAQIDAIRESAAAMDRIFIVEVMGRSQGHIAIEAALATGAEAVLVPERAHDDGSLSQLSDNLVARVDRDRSSVLVIVAEGAVLAGTETELGAFITPGTAAKTVETYVGAAAERAHSDAEVRVSVLGHTLRGAPPTAYTRNLATRSGLAALDHIVGELDRLGGRSRGGSAHPPALLGMKNDGRVERVAIEGDMIRRDSRVVRNLASMQNDRLAF